MDRIARIKKRRYSYSFILFILSILLIAFPSKLNHYSPLGAEALEALDLTCFPVPRF
jgi:hypothetical protein